MNFSWKKLLEELRVLIILIIIAFTIKATLIEVYVVPTGSMENTILTGDMLIGNKFIYGMRTPTWIGIPYTRIGISIPWYRLPKFKEVESGDVTIFEFPRDPFQKYVKRCIGTPADSIYIDRGDIIINGEKMEFPNDGKYVKGFILEPGKKEKLYSYLNGNRDNVSGFVVPYKGMKIDFNKVTDWQVIISLLVQDGNEVKLGQKQFTMIDPDQVGRTHGFLKYKLLKLISSNRNAALREQRDRSQFIRSMYKDYQEKNLVNPWHKNINTENTAYLLENLTINGEAIKNIGIYELHHDFYFFMGDNRDSSYDSRFWGFVSETQILGTPLFALVNLFKFKLRLKVVS